MAFHVKMAFMTNQPPPSKNADQLSFPDTLRPLSSSVEFPQITGDNLQQLNEQGWFRIGVATAILDVDGNVLILKHAESDKNTAGVHGPLCETMKAIPGSGAESVKTTLSRCIQEELGIDPARLSLSTPTGIAPYFITQWPAGNKEEYTDKFVFGICPITFADSESVRLITSSFRPNNEVSSIEFLPLEEVPSRELRVGVSDWLSSLKAIDPLNSCSSFRRLITSPDINQAGSDLDL
jgi:hypothetical protein